MTLPLEEQEPYEIETATTFDSVEFAFLWAVFLAWLQGKKLTIRNARTRLTTSIENKLLTV